MIVVAIAGGALVVLVGCFYVYSRRCRSAPDVEHDFAGRDTGGYAQFTAPVERQQIVVLTADHEMKESATGVVAQIPLYWFEYYDGEGRSYFFNSKTGATQWERPSA